MKTMQKTLRLLVVGAFLFSVTPALCQSGQGSGENNSSMSQSTESDDDNDNDTNWGWIGLAGLLGLLGLRKKEHHHEDVSGRVNR